MLKGFLIIIFIFISAISTKAQVDSTSVSTTKEGRSEVLINGIVQWSTVQGDLQDKFKNFIGLGGGFLYKTKSEWYIGFDGAFMFNDKTKNAEAVISDILSSNGTIIGANGRATNIFISQRGMTLQFLKVGHLVWRKKVLNGNPSSGLLAMTGIGLLQHQYRIIDRDNSAPQLAGNYSKGYDQLRNGLSVNPFLGYVYYDNDKFINFILGIEYSLAFMESRRDFDFLLMKKDETKTTDHLVSLKLIWNIPIRKKMSRDYYYF